MSKLSTQTWDAIASALEYPRKGTEAAVRTAAAEVQARGEDTMGAALLGLADYIANARHGEPEERYTVLFDMKPVCSLYVGWHIFEDTYARGALLAGLAKELNDAGVFHGYDLPDYLPTLLRLIPRLRDEESQVLLVHTILLRGMKPIVEKITESDAAWVPIVTALPELMAREIPKGEAEIPSLRRPLEVIQC